jgi:hypothetical protein
VPLSPEEIAAAEKMHAFVRGYERQSAASRSGPWFFIPIMLSSAIQMHGQKAHGTAYVYLGVIVAVVLFFVVQRRLFKARYDRERFVVQALERDHADELPWVREDRFEDEVKKHLAAVHEIELEIAKA